MFEVGWSEYLVIFGLALVVLGPEKLPKLAASIGRWVGRARVMARQFRDQLESEAETIRSSVQDVHKDLHTAATDLQSSVSEVKRDFESGMSDPASQPNPAHESPHPPYLEPDSPPPPPPLASPTAEAHPHEAAPSDATLPAHPPAEGQDEQRH